MRLREYVDTRGRGEISRIVRVAEVAGTTVHDALNGHPIARYDTAKRISEATGGAVSIPELCEPSAPIPAPIPAGPKRARRPIRRRRPSAERAA